MLFQREWQSFGHKFQDRLWCVHKPSERSPVFFQYLDCVHNIIHKYPTAFEFNEAFLVGIIDCMYSMAYADVRHNNEAGRAEDEAIMASTWWSVFDGPDAASFRNPGYDSAFVEVLSPPEHARVWTAYFNRWAAKAVSPADWTIERILAANDVAQDRHLFVEDPPLCTGWVQDAKGRDRFLVLHSSHGGESCIIAYEREKSQSLVVAAQIALPDGNYAVRAMPKRTAGVKRPTFQLKVKELSSKAAQNEGGQLQELAIKARKMETLSISLKAGQQATWRVVIDEYDVSFEATFEEKPCGKKTKEGVLGTKTVVPSKMLGDPKEAKKGGNVSGTYTAASDGQLQLFFDNSFSKLRAKKVLYSLSGVDMDGDAGAESRAVLIDAVTQDNEDPAPAESIVLLTDAAAIAGQQLAVEISAHLANRLAVDSRAVKLKALTITKELTARGSHTFQVRHFIFGFPLPLRLRHCLFLDFPLPLRLRRCLCPAFSLPLRLRRCLCPVFPLPSRSRSRKAACSRSGRAATTTPQTQSTGTSRPRSSEQSPGRSCRSSTTSPPHRPACAPRGHASPSRSTSSRAGPTSSTPCGSQRCGRAPGSRCWRTRRTTRRRRRRASSGA